MPFQPVNDILSTSTFADACGVSGIGADGDCRFFEPTRDRRQDRAGLRPVRPAARRAGTPTGTTSRRTSAWRGGRTCRPAGCGRSSAIRSRRRCAPATRCLRPRGHGASSPGQYGANPGSTLSVTRSEANGLLVPAGRRPWPVLLRDRDRLPTPGVRPVPAVTATLGLHAEPVVSDPGRAPIAPDSINIFHPDIQVAYARSWTRQLPARAVDETWRSTSATSARAASISGPRRTTTRSQHHRERVLRRVPAGDGEPAGQQRAPGRGGHVRVHGRQPARAAADLPRLLQRLARRRTTRRRTRAPTGRTPRSPAGSIAHSPSPINAAERSRRQRRRGATTPPRAGLPANFFVVNPDVDRVDNVYDERRVQQLRRAADRAAAPAVARLPDQRQLPVRARGRIGLPRHATTAAS